MHRFYISPENWDPRALILRGGEAHHARDVLRMERGQRAVVFNGRGREITAEIVELARDEVHLRKLQENESPPLPTVVASAVVSEVTRVSTRWSDAPNARSSVRLAP